MRKLSENAWDLTPSEARLHALVLHHGSLRIAGITECRDALALIEGGLVELTEGLITPEGGSGTIQRRK